MSAPAITVLMPVYNAAPFLRESVSSILGQTFRDFELLIIDDGSTDHSVKVLELFNDQRIRLVRHAENQRLIATLNEGLLLAKGKYVARMDADDVSLPNRLQLQWDYMERHPDVAVCGMQMEDLDKRQALSRVYEAPDMISAALLFSCALAHPTVMIRRAVTTAFPSAYDPGFPHAEDYALWAQISVSHRLANLKEVGVRYRLHAGQVSRKYEDIQLAGIREIHRFQLQRLGLHPGEDTLERFFRFSYLDFDDSVQFCRETEQLLLQIYQHGCDSGLYNSAALRKAIGVRWYGFLSYKLSGTNNKIWPLLCGPASQKFLSLTQYLKLLVKAMIRRGQRQKTPTDGMGN